MPSERMVGEWGLTDIQPRADSMDTRVWFSPIDPATGFGTYTEIRPDGSVSRKLWRAVSENVSSGAVNIAFHETDDRVIDETYAVVVSSDRSVALIDSIFYDSDKARTDSHNDALRRMNERYGLSLDDLDSGFDKWFIEDNRYVRLSDATAPE